MSSKRLLSLTLARISKQKHLVFLSFFVVFLSILSFALVLASYQLETTEARVLGIKKTNSKSGASLHQLIITPTAIPIPTSSPTPTPSPSPTKPIPTIQPTSTPIATNNPQYTAEKIGETTWLIKDVPNDKEMASPNDVFNSLNSYRHSKGLGTLSWDSNLSDLASSRVNHLAGRNDLDSHAGFREFMNNDGFAKAGFNGLGENSAHLSGAMSGERIVKEIFGADPEHDGNQLRSDWTHVGVGVNGNFVNVNFGKGKR